MSERHAELTAEWHTCVPSPALHDVVDHYAGYRLAGFPPGVHWGVPSARPTFIVSIGAPIDVIAQTDPQQDPDRYGCVVSGLQATSARIAHDGHQEGIAIELTPHGFRRLFGRPARDLWNTSVELADVVGPLGAELRERVAVATSWTERFAACDAVLSRLVVDHEPAVELQRCWDLLVTSGGQVPIDALATDVGWSRQHLRRRFVDEFGLPPKLAARVIRFERACRTLRRGGATIADVAAACGYYDQSHLDRDFREFTGASPSRLLTEDLPSVQDRIDVVASR
jgi:AraC-like DNA-binding protein